MTLGKIGMIKYSVSLSDPRVCILVLSFPLDQSQKNVSQFLLHIGLPAVMLVCLLFVGVLHW